MTATPRSFERGVGLCLRKKANKILTTRFFSPTIPSVNVSKPLSVLPDGDMSFKGTGEL